MAYQFETTETVEDGVRRIFREQIDGAVAALESDEVGREKGVHEARKHCKRIRALMRLVRPGMEDVYQRENAWFRDASSSLSDVRDADVMIATAESVIGLGGKKIDAAHAAAVRAELQRRRSAVVEARVDQESRIEQFKALISDARRRAEAWPSEFGGVETAMAGMKKTYKRGRDVMKDAYADGESEAFHDWRKRVKYHRYHLEMLEGIGGKKTAKRRRTSKELSDILGEDHDLHVLNVALHETPDAFGGAAAVESFSKVIEKRLKKLRKMARPVGKDLFDAKPSKLARALQSRWEKRMSPVSASEAASGDAAAPSAASPAPR